MTPTTVVAAVLAAAAVEAPAALVRLVEPWASLYADSTPVATIVVFGHIAALMVAGGLAITIDRGTLRALRNADQRSAHLPTLAASHRVVIPGLVASAVTGVLMFAADLEAYFVSPIYWTKMTLVALLLANGYAMTRIESSMRSGTETDAAWKRLALSARASLFFWFATAFVGVALVNAG